MAGRASHLCGGTQLFWASMSRRRAGQLAIWQAAFLDSPAWLAMDVVFQISYCNGFKGSSKILDRHRHQSLHDLCVVASCLAGGRGFAGRVRRCAMLPCPARRTRVRRDRHDHAYGPGSLLVRPALSLASENSLAAAAIRKSCLKLSAAEFNQFAGSNCPLVPSMWRLELSPLTISTSPTD